MAARTATPAPNDAAMWRRLLRLAHPDTGGDAGLFVWAREMQERIAGCSGACASPRPHEPRMRARAASDRIPYDPALGFADEFLTLTMRALGVGQRAEEPHRSVPNRFLGIRTDAKTA